MKKQKRHHYLPQFYLYGFCKDDKIWVFDRYSNEYRKQTPINTAVEKDYYTIISKNGIKNTEVEKWYSIIEGQTKPIIEKIDNREKITKKDKEKLSIFVALMMTRVPDFEKAFNEFHDKISKKINKQMFSSIDKTKEILDDFEQKTKQKLNTSPEELFNFVHGDRYNVLTNKGYRIASNLDNSLNFSFFFKQMDWLISYSSSSLSFITTDNPFSIVPPENYDKPQFWGVGLLTKDAQKIFPLSQKSCLIMLNKGDEILYRNANDNQVRDINIFVADNSDRFVIAPNKKLLESLVNESKLDKWRKGPRVIVE